jgi:hypothetical protein
MRHHLLQSPYTDLAPENNPNSAKNENPSFQVSATTEGKL